MKITVNGRPEEIQPGSILDFVRTRELKADSVVVEHNRKIVKRERWDSVQLRENDRLEVLGFVGGG